jgi:hypothetical protein
MGSGWRRRFSVAATALALASCAGPRVELQHGVFRAPKLFRVTVPGADWTVMRATDSELQLRYPATGAGILANVECGPAPARQELAVLARRLFVGLRARETLDNGVTTLGGLPAVHASMEAQVTGENERMRLEAYVTKDEQCVYDLVYVAPTAVFAERHGDFRRFVESFARE